MFIQEVGLVDAAAALKADIVLGESLWLRLNHRACCYPESRQNNEKIMWTMKHLLRADSRMRSRELVMGRLRGCGRETTKRGKWREIKKVPVTKRVWTKFACNGTDAFFEYDKTNISQFMVTITLSTGFAQESTINFFHAFTN